MIRGSSNRSLPTISISFKFGNIFVEEFYFLLSVDEKFLAKKRFISLRSVTSFSVHFSRVAQKSRVIWCLEKFFLGTLALAPLFPLRNLVYATVLMLALCCTYGMLECISDNIHMLLRPEALSIS